MSRNGYTGPKLPKQLLDQVQDSSGSRFRQNNISRKDRRKAERQQKKAQSTRRPITRQKRQHIQEYDSEGENGPYGDDISSPPQDSPQRTRNPEVKPLKSILKKPKPVQVPVDSESEDQGSEGTEVEPFIPRAARVRLEEDDAEIAALERKLGIKGKKSKALEQDGLGWLVDGSESDSGEQDRSLKRKRPEDSKWLRDKRLRATEADTLEPVKASGVDEEHAESLGGEEDEFSNPFSEDELGSDDFEGFDSEASENVDANAYPPPTKQRENPYVPPISKDVAPSAKYIPPSLRKAAESDEETLRQLRRQIQGLLNRLSEANMLSLLTSLEDLYNKNARQYVTSTIVELLVGLVSDASILNDTFLVLHAGFAAAVYKIVGTDFGAQLLDKLVESFDQFRNSRTVEGKQTLNLVGFFSCLYIFQAIGSAIMFDYIRLLLGELSENNTELLLRIIRTAGQALRQDDPSALKDIVLLLQRSVANLGEDKLSVRTKFMIETINSLKNNRMKTGAAASNLSAEQISRMKKLLNSLSSSRSVKATEPLRVTLTDIRDREKKGKWWLVGASYNDPAKLTTADGSKSAIANRHYDLDAGYESETPGSVNLHKLARSQGMNTDVRRAIFIAILSSADYQESHMRILKLHLKSKQMLEIPRVLVHCAGAEQSYNPFYALVARKFCGEHRLRKAFQYTLWNVLGQMDGNENGEETAEEMSVRKVVNLAKFYGSLIADRGLSIAVLKKLEFAYVQGNTSMFVEVLLTSVFAQLWKKHKLQEDYEGAVKAVFLQTAGAANIIQGLRYIISANVTKAELANGKAERKAIVAGCEIAIQALDEASTAVPIAEGDGDSSDDDP